MKKFTYFLPIVVVIILLIAVFIPKIRKSQSEGTENITNFEECIAAGNPALESYPRQCNTKDGKHFTEVIASPTPSPFTENWQNYTNTEFGISFPYPNDFTLSKNQASADNYYISIISPLDTEKPPKMTTLGENELKIEIVIEVSSKNDSSEKCYLDHTENPNVISQKQIVVSGITTTTFVWEGLGDGEFTCVIKNNRRYMINKYPIKTKYQNEYDNFIGNLLID